MSPNVLWITRGSVVGRPLPSLRWDVASSCSIGIGEELSSPGRDRSPQLCSDIPGTVSLGSCRTSNYLRRAEIQIFGGVNGVPCSHPLRGWAGKGVRSNFTCYTWIVTLIDFLFFLKFLSRSGGWPEDHRTFSLTVMASERTTPTVQIPQMLSLVFPSTACDRFTTSHETMGLDDVNRDCCRGWGRT